MPAVPVEPPHVSEDQRMPWTRFLLSLKLSVQTLREAGLSLQDCRALYPEVADLKAGGFDASQLKKAGYALQDLKQGGYTYVDLKAAGFSVGMLGEAGFDNQSKANADVKQLKAAGFGAAELITGGFAPSELAQAGFNITRPNSLQGSVNSGEVAAVGIMQNEPRPRTPSPPSHPGSTATCSPPSNSATGVLAATYTASVVMPGSGRDTSPSHGQRTQPFSALELARVGFDLGPANNIPKRSSDAGVRPRDAQLQQGMQQPQLQQLHQRQSSSPLARQRSLPPSPTGSSNLGVTRQASSATVQTAAPQIQYSGRAVQSFRHGADALPAASLQQKSGAATPGAPGQQQHQQQIQHSRGGHATVPAGNPHGNPHGSSARASGRATPRNNTSSSRGRPGP